MDRNDHYRYWQSVPDPLNRSETMTELKLDQILAMLSVLSRQLDRIELAVIRCKVDSAQAKQVELTTRLATVERLLANQTMEKTDDR
jgi:hypothetical protein